MPARRNLLMIVFTITTLLSAFLVTVCSAACEQIDVCSCRDTESNKVISLYPLASADGPAFSVSGSGTLSNYSYYYNPCLNFTRPGTGNCTNVAVCQEDVVHHYNFVLGWQPTARFATDNSSANVLLTYTGESTWSPTLRRSAFELVCDEEATTAKLEFVDEDPVGNYRFKLTSKCACPGGCPPTCTAEGPKNCACRLSKSKELINLLSLDNPDAPLSVHTPTSKIYFNPCSGMDFGTGCHDSVSCVYQAGEYIEYGSPSTGDYSVDESGQVTLSYTSSDGSKQTHIRLVCDMSQRHYPRLSNVSEPTSTVLELELRSVCACPGECFGPALTCSRIDDCTCSLNEGLGSINLHELDNPLAPLKRFVEDQSDPSAGVWYYYNPCTNFTVPGDNDLCVNVAACQVGQPKPIDFSLGFQNTVTYRVSNTDKGVVTLLYTEGYHDRQVAVTLHCNQTAIVPSLQFDEENPEHHYFLSLHSKEACPKSSTIPTLHGKRRVRPSRPVLRD